MRAGIALIAVACGVVGRAWPVRQVFTALELQVEMISQGASKVNISFVVPGEREKEVIQALHSCFFEDKCIVPMR